MRRLVVDGSRSPAGGLECRRRKGETTVRGAFVFGRGDVCQPTPAPKQRERNRHEIAVSRIARRRVVVQIWDTPFFLVEGPGDI